jgi:DNA-binding response OmpR family regulator
MDYKVLIIDDDTWMQRILSKTLQSFGFRDDYLAPNGFEGISISVEEQPHLIILDILMPELSGHQTLKILKHIKTTKNIPVLMVSAMADTENLGLAVKTGMAGFISKPFTRSTIYEKLVAIYGKENLERIANGDPLFQDRDIDYSREFEEAGIIRNEEMLESIGRTLNVVEQEAQQAQNPGVQDRIVDQYKDEEQKSLDAIKKILMKARK